MAEAATLRQLQGLRPRITLEVYSGRENPSWTLSEDQAKDLLTRLEALPAASRKPADEDGLGYQGFVAEYNIKGAEFRVHVFRGLAAVDAQTVLRDESRSLEAWLLGTAGTAMSESLRPYVEGELKKP